MGNPTESLERILEDHALLLQPLSTGSPAREALEESLENLIGSIGKISEEARQRVATIQKKYAEELVVALMTEKRAAPSSRRDRRPLPPTALSTPSPEDAAKVESMMDSILGHGPRPRGAKLKIVEVFVQRFVQAGNSAKAISIEEFAMDYDITHNTVHTYLPWLRHILARSSYQLERVTNSEDSRKTDGYRLRAKQASTAPQ